MNLGAIISTAQGNIEDTSQASDTALRRFVRDVYNEVWGYAFWPELEKTYDTDTTDGTQTILLATIGSDLGKIKRVFYKPENINSWQRVKKEEGGIDILMTYDPTVEGDPRRWVEWEQKLWMWPVPDVTGTANLRVLGKKTVAELADDTDEPFFPAEFHQIMVDGLTWKYFDLDDDTRAQLYERYFRRGMAKMEHERVAERDEDGVPTVQFGEE